MSRSEHSGVQSVERVFEVLEALSQGERKVADLAQSMGLPRTTVYRLLGTLEPRGYVRRNPLTGAYRLGFRLFELGNRLIHQIGLEDEATSRMEELSRRCGETVNLAVLDDFQVLYIRKVESREPLKMGLLVGTRVPAHCSGLGKAMLAFSGPDHVDRYISAVSLTGYTPNTITQADALREEMERIRRQGYAIDDEEYFPGIRCVAAPVLDHEGRVAAGLSISGPLVRMGWKRMRALAGDIRECAKGISSGLGYRWGAGTSEDR